MDDEPIIITRFLDGSAAIPVPRSEDGGAKRLDTKERSAARLASRRAAKKAGVKVDAEPETHEGRIAAMAILAMSLDLPVVDGHPNRMPFTGILTRLDVASDSPPHGTSGKRIILTTAAAEQALPSLLGMGVDLTKDMDGHDATKKVGIITAAHIDGDAIHIEGFIYAADFPREALRIQLDKASLGFSFEAQQLSVESMATDPLVIKKCVFTGAAILLKNEAAYQTTALAAAKAKEHEHMDEIKDTVAAAVAAALEPMTAAITAITATQTAQNERFEAFTASPALQAIEANAAMCARMEPHCAKLESAADGMEKDGIGVATPNGHVHHLRRMAGAMRGDAARGKVPHEYHDSGSYWASQEQPKGDAPKGDEPEIDAASAEAPKTKPPATTGDDDVNLKDDPEFMALKASFDSQGEILKKIQDSLAASETRAADLTAKLAAAAEQPQRKTISPANAAAIAKHGLEPDEATNMISLSRIDAALSGTKMEPTDRIAFKLRLQRDGLMTNT